MTIKKILSITLCICILLSLTACKDKVVDEPTAENTITNPSEQSTYDENQVPDDVYADPTEPVDKYVVDENGETTDIRNDGYLPSKEQDMTEEELDYYINDVVNAVIKLDTEKLAKYASDENDAKIFEAIAQSDTHRDMYNKTISNVIYLSDSRYFVYKDPFYTYSRWYNEEVQAGSTPSITSLSNEDVDGVYAKYYNDATYIIERVYNYKLGLELKDGSIKFDLNGILELMGYAKVSDLDPSNSISYANIVFGTIRNAVANNDADNPASNEILDIIISRDLDAMVNYVDNNPNYDLNYANKEATYDDCYQLYYKNELLRNKISTWMDENVEVYRSDFGVVTYAKSNISHKDNWPFNLLTDEERAQITDLPVYTDFVTYEIGDIVEWGQYYMIVEQMIYDNALAYLYVD